MDESWEIGLRVCGACGSRSMAAKESDIGVGGTVTLYACPDCGAKVGLLAARALGTLTAFCLFLAAVVVAIYLAQDGLVTTERAAFCLLLLVLLAAPFIWARQRWRNPPADPASDPEWGQFARGFAVTIGGIAAVLAVAVLIGFLTM